MTRFPTQIARPAPLAATLACLAVLMITACARTGTPPDAATATPETPATSARPSGLDLSGFDRSVDPAENLYNHANGTWLEETEIPSDRAEYSMFTMLAEQAEDQLLEILDEISARDNAPSGSPDQIIRDFARSLTDRDRADALGIRPLAEDLEHIAALDSHEAVWAYFPEGALAGSGAPLAAFVNQDARNATEYILYLTQTGLTLPDRDYYLEDSERYENARIALTDYVARVFGEASLRDGEAAGNDVLAIESDLAEIQWSRVQNRDPVATYNRHNMDSLAELAPEIPFAQMFRALELEPQEALVVHQPDYLENLNDVVTAHPVSAWRHWLHFKLIDNYAAWLTPDLARANFEFHQQTLRGVPEMRPLDRRVLEVLNARVGFALGELYVDRHFSPAAKDRMEELVTNLKAAFARSLDEVEWMTDKTRTEAHAKLARFNTKIGYPDVWRDYDGLEIHPGEAVANLRRSSQFEYRRNLDKLGQPIDRDEWFMTPQTVNAYYSPLMNEIVFPAAILQPPFFDPEADDAVNYGAIGAVIGHELGHGFDDSGRRFDGDGNLRDWWTEADAAEYETRAGKLVEQYNRYNPIDDLYVDGKLTLGENIGDLGGLTLAWRAYQLSLDNGGAPVIDGYTGPQRFFLGWAQAWRRKYQDEELRRRLRTDSHSPAYYRVNGVVPNMPAFIESFGVEPGNDMWMEPEERVEIW